MWIPWAFAALLLVKTTGGLSAVFGMVSVIGLAQVAFAFIFQRLKGVFTVQIAGLAVLLIGLGLGYYGLKLILQAETGVSLEQQGLLCFNFWKRAQRARIIKKQTLAQFTKQQKHFRHFASFKI